jgi:acetyltransferase-like isoleucine patch superfamily enzyme
LERKDFLENEDQLKVYDSILDLHKTLDDAFLEKHNRSLPFADTLLDRWDRAQKLGFGEKTSIYDSSLIIGDVKVGTNCWIGPFSIVDGSGGLNIGNFCTVSAGVHIYSHDNVKQTLSSGKLPIQRAPVNIGNNVYLAPNVIVAKGVTIGSFCVIGTNSFVNKDIPSHSIALGQPAKVVGKVEIDNTGEITFIYH